MLIYKRLLTFRKYIEYLRNELIKGGQQYGLNSREVITKSQELDHYLAMCQKCCPSEHRK
jgi:hypothetical protein